MRLNLRRARAVFVVLTMVAGAVTVSGAQTSGATPIDTAPHGQVVRSHYWRNVSAGFLSSILIHEAAHITTSLVLGKTPTIGFDKLRPTVYSGIDASKQPYDQYLFSSMGLNAQAVLDELILDTPHSRGSSFERGILAGGIGTALFYITIGRNASVSDVELMARYSSLNKTHITLIYGGIAALHTMRIHHDGHYANFFVRPTADAGRRLQIGLNLTSEP